MPKARSCLFYSPPIPDAHLPRPKQHGDDGMTTSQQSAATERGVRMLRTAMGPAIAGFLEDPGIVEVMLNPDGSLWEIGRASCRERV